MCLVAIAGLIVLQFYWIRDYYKKARFNFEREINLAFEDAIKKDFELRCDTIEQLLTEQLMDSSAYNISSRFIPAYKAVQHIISNTKNKKDYNAFSSAELPDSLTAGDTSYKRKIASFYAHTLRTEDLENYIVYYRVQSLGQFLSDRVKLYGFDTLRLRRVFSNYLRKKGITTGFRFSTTLSDSLFNEVQVPDSLAKKGMVFTKAFPTHKWWVKGEQYVRAVFDNPDRYVLARMKWILAGSLLLILLVALCIWLLLKALFHEKKMAAIKNDFINNITHELKTPVATITAALEALQEDGLEKEKRSRYTRHARNESARLAGLIDNILDLSLYQQKKMPVHPETVNMNEMIQELAENLELFSPKPVHFRYRNESGLQEIRADRQLFRQALMNVLDNAVKYSGNEADISVFCQADKNYFTITCTDRGEGIARSALPYVLEKFYREPKNGHAVKGYGLGLNYVQEIMKAHHGKIALQSEKGKGTTVSLSWPL